MPGSMKNFRKRRRRDTNLEIGIDLDPSFLDYFIFNEPALNGFASELAMERHNAKNSYEIKKVQKIEVKPLSEVLGEYCNGGSIDSLTVDVEVLDLRVLGSNDWNKYRPKIVLAEVLARDLQDLQDNALAAFMTSKAIKSAQKRKIPSFLQTKKQKKMKRDETNNGILVISSARFVVSHL